MYVKSSIGVRTLNKCSENEFQFHGVASCSKLPRGEHFKVYEILSSCN